MGSSSRSPWDVLVAIASQTRSIKEQAPQTSLIEPLWQGLSIVIGDDNFLTPLNVIEEISLVPKIANMKTQMTAIKGVGLYHSRIMMLVDMREIMVNQPVTLTKDARVLMLDFGETIVGCLVDSVMGLKSVPLNEVDWEPKDKSHIDEGLTILGVLKTKHAEMRIISLKDTILNRCYNKLRDAEDV